MTLYGLKNCDTCRKALKFLSDVELVDVRLDGIPIDVLSKALDTFGMALVNTRSTTWRGLSDTERARPPLDLLVDYPALMKRPLIVDGETSYLGWSKETQSALNAG